MCNSPISFRIAAGLLLAGCALLSVSGCGVLFESASYTPVNYYDLGKPRTHKTPPVKIKIGTVRSEGPENSRMAFRTSPTQIRFDEYNRWGQPPDKLLRRYLMLYLNDPALGDVDGDKPMLTIDLRILCFECDLQQNKAVLIIEASVKKPLQGDNLLWSGTYHEEVDLKTKTATAYAEATSEAAHVVCGKLSQKLIDLAPRN